MNLLDAVVKKIIGKREFNSTIEWNLDSTDDLFNIDFVEFDCVTKDMGGVQNEKLIYKKHECPYIKEGYEFKH